MKTNTRGICKLFVPMIFMLVFTACNITSDELPGNDNGYEIGSSEYAVLSEKSLDFFSDFRFDSFATMLTDEIEYEFPDGKKIFGKANLINYLTNYKEKTGLESMKILNANYVAINMNQRNNKHERAGVKVLTDFTNIMTFEHKNVSVKMNFTFHFNKAKMIEKITTNYDSSNIK